MLMPEGPAPDPSRIGAGVFTRVSRRTMKRYLLVSASFHGPPRTPPVQTRGCVFTRVSRHAAAATPGASCIRGLKGLHSTAARP